MEPWLDSCVLFLKFSFYSYPCGKKEDDGLIAPKKMAMPFEHQSHESLNKELKILISIQHFEGEKFCMLLNLYRVH